MKAASAFRAWSYLPPTFLRGEQRSFLQPCYQKDIFRFGIPSTSLPKPTLSIQTRTFASSQSRVAAESSYARPPDDLDKNITEEEQDHFNKITAKDKEKQVRTPWMREGSDTAPASKNRSSKAMTKGKLLTTPSRLLKLVLPLTTHDQDASSKDSEPLALLVHPQQPLSYLERLIQSELPMISLDGKERPPAVHFRAEDSMQSSRQPHELEDDYDEHEFDEAEETRFDGKIHKTGKLKPEENADAEEQLHEGRSNEQVKEDALRGGHGEGGVESYSGLGQEGSSRPVAERSRFVRWSKSTEIGDFIKDAARGQEFAIEIEGAPREIRVGVPSFNDRTYYLRMRLRKRARTIATLAAIKRECDVQARKSAQNYAYAGFATLGAWGLMVYWLTFMTSLGWDVMEPVTYLVSIVGIMGGYGWFLFNRREVSYQSAMNLQVTRRQHQLYEAKGFDLRKWEYLVEEGNALRREIMAIASEYDVEWDEKDDGHDDKVIKALREHRQKKEGKKEELADEEEEDEQDEKEVKANRKKE